MFACAAQFPFAMPQMETFRDLTGTQGVDTYALSYHNYCHGDGSATQVTADSLEALGIDPRSENPLLPNAAVLRAAEAVDSILNAADAGSPEVENSINAGRVLCSIVVNATLTLLRTLGLRRDTNTLPYACAVPARWTDLLHIVGHNCAGAHKFPAVGQLDLPAALRRLCRVHRRRNGKEASEEA